MKLIPGTKLSESAKTAKFHNGWILCILITLLLFIIASTLQSIVLGPVMTVLMFSDPSLIQSAAAGDFAGIMEHSTEITRNMPWWFMVLSLILTVTVIVVCLFYTTKIDRHSIATMGFCGSRPALEYLTGYGIGFCMFFAALLICVVTKAATIDGISNRISWAVLLFFVGYLIQGLSEEVLCRGVLMQKLSIRYAPIVAILLNSVFFAALHLANPGITPLALPNLVLFGVFASLYMWKRGNIWGIAALHSAWNFTQGNLFGVQVSGTALAPSLFSVSLAEGSTWMNGGSFGLEGGLGVTIVYVIGIVILLFLPVRKEARLDA